MLYGRCAWTGLTRMAVHLRSSCDSSSDWYSLWKWLSPRSLAGNRPPGMATCCCQKSCHRLASGELQIVATFSLCCWTPSCDAPASLPPCACEAHTETCSMCLRLILPRSLWHVVCSSARKSGSLRSLLRAASMRTG